MSTDSPIVAWVLLLGTALSCSIAFAAQNDTPATAISGPTPAANEKEIFSCTFKTNLTKPWRIIGGKWEVSEDGLRQVNAGLDDPKKVLLALGEASDLSTEIEVTAKLRLDRWQGGEWARAGLSCCSDPLSGHGFNLVFNQGRLTFMQDYIAWGTELPFFLQDQRLVLAENAQAAGRDERQSLARRRPGAGGLDGGLEEV